MRSSHSLERLSVDFSDAHAVAGAGLLLPATLAERLGLKELLDEHVDLGRAPGAASPGVKALTLIYSALAGGVVDAVAAGKRGVDQGERLHAGARSAGGAAEIDVLVEELLEAQPLRQGGGQKEAGARHPGGAAGPQ